jgi:addiction module HigA family antidote
MTSRIEPSRAFTPDWTSHPGETIQDLLEQRGWRQVEFAKRAGLSTRLAGDLVTGRATLSHDTALRINEVLGGSVKFWLTREAQYQAALKRHQPPSAKQQVTSGSPVEPPEQTAEQNTNAHCD